MSNPTQQLVMLGLVWAAWAGLHSLLLWARLRGRLENALGWSGTFYRACYSGLALVTFMPVSWWAYKLGGVAPFFWPWPRLPVQAALWALVMVFICWAWISFKKAEWTSWVGRTSPPITTNLRIW